MLRSLIVILLLFPSLALAQGPSPFKLTGAAPAPITPARAGGDYLRLPSGDLRIRSSGAAFDLKLGSDEALSADRLFKLNVGNAARTITLSGSPTLGDWFDQSVKVAASPTFLTVTSTNDATINGVSVGIGPGGAFNARLGQIAFSSATTATHSTAIGYASLNAMTSGGTNTAVGMQSFAVAATGDDNLALGYRAGFFQADGATSLEAASSSLYIGSRTRGFSNADNNTIVIGYAAIGEGANKTTIGNSSTTGFHPFGTPTFGDGVDASKKLTLDLSGITTATTRTWIVPDATDTFVGLTATQTLTNKTLTTPTISGAITIPDNVRQTFNPGVDASGLNVGAQTTDPGTPSNGDLYYDSDDHLLRARINSAWVSLGAGGGTPTAITVADTTDSTSFVALFESATGDLGPKTDGGLLYDASNGGLRATLIGVGAAVNTTAGITVTKAFTDPAAASYGLNLAATTTLTANSANTVQGGNFSSITDQGAFNQTQAYGVRGGTFNAGASGASGTITGGAAGVFTYGNSGAGTLTNAYGIVIAAATNSGGGTVTNNYGIDISAQTVGSTQIAGIRSQIASGSGRYNILASGTADNSFTGLIVGGSSILSTSATAGVGYGTGSGGTVTQVTSRTTGVTINKVCGSIQTDTTAIIAGASASFTVTNSAVAIGDTIVLSIRSGQTNKQTRVTVTTVAAGSFEISVMNHNITTSETGAMIINFAVLKAVTS